MKIRHSITLSTIAVALAACSHPIERSVERASVSSSVSLIDGPIGARLVIADQSVVVDKEGQANLAVSDGWHEVEIMSGSQVIHSERVFVQDGTRRVIDLRP